MLLERKTGEKFFVQPVCEIRPVERRGKSKTFHARGTKTNGHGKTEEIRDDKFLPQLAFFK